MCIAEKEIKLIKNKNISNWIRKNKRSIKDYLILSFSAFIAVIAYDYLIVPTTRAGIFPTGFAAIARILAIYSSPSYIILQNTLNYVFLFLINLPLIIFATIKVSWRFTTKSVYWLLLEILINYIVMNLPYIGPGSLHLLIDFNLLIKGSDINYQIWLFIFAIIAGIIYGYCFSLTYHCRTGIGTDLFAVYISVKKQKSIAIIGMYVNFSCLIIVMLLSTFSFSITDFQKIFKDDTTLSILDYRVKFFFGPSLFASITLAFTEAIIVRMSYPKHEYRTMFITTTNDDIVIKAMKKAGAILNDISTWDIFNTQLDENKSSKGHKIIMSTISLLEWTLIKEAVVKADPEARIFLQKVDRISGKFIVRNDL